MFDFFGSLLFWIYIFLMFVLQFINGIGIYGRGLKRDKLTVFGSLGAIVLAIFTWINEGFIAFIVFIIFWFLFIYITTPIVLALLRKTGVNPVSPEEIASYSYDDQMDDLYKNMEEELERRKQFKEEDKT